MFRALWRLHEFAIMLVDNSEHVGRIVCDILGVRVPQCSVAAPFMLFLEDTFIGHFGFLINESPSPFDCYLCVLFALLLVNLLDF